MKYFKLFILLLISTIGFSQSRITMFKNVQLRGAQPDMVFTTLDVSVLYKSFVTKVAVPKDGSVSYMDITFTEADPLSDDFLLTDANNGDTLSYSPGIYYHGTTVYGDIASLSITQSGIFGMITRDTAKYNIQDNNDGYYAIYNPNVISGRNLWTCETPEDTSQAMFDVDGLGLRSMTVNCVRTYYEIPFSMLSLTGGTAQTMTDWATAVWNNVKLSYDGVQISTVLNQVGVWTVADPYIATSSITNLYTFRDLRDTLSQEFLNNDALGVVGVLPGNEGGVASAVGGICWILNGIPRNHFIADASLSYSAFPSYSWTVEVAAHEEGHLMGADHTHNCNYTACMLATTGVATTVDACYTIEGVCTAGVFCPAGQGTIMSYCHLNGCGINFNNSFGGYGECPQNAMYTFVESRTCLGTSCGVAPIVYCTSQSTSSATYFNIVKIGTNSNSSGASNYSNFTGITLGTFPGGVVTKVKYKLNLATACTVTVKVWIDYNEDGTFDNVTEFLGKKKSVLAAGTSIWLTVKGTAPLSALSGNTRMRISAQCGGNPANLIPCLNPIPVGEVEDYTITITQ